MDDVHDYRPIAAWRNPHTWYITAIMIVCSIFYYLDTIIELLGWPKSWWDMLYTVHDLHRLLFFIPVLYAAYIFRVRGVIVTALILILIFLPHAMFISPYPEALLRAMVFVIIIGGVGILVAKLLNSITERKQAEEALRESEEKYRGIFGKVPISIILLDKDGQMVDVNPYHVTNIGKGKTTQKDYIGKNLITHPSIVNAGLSETYARLLKGEPFNIEDVYFPTTTGGTDSYFNVKGVPLFEKGQVIGALTIHEDITERKRAEEALRESEEKHKSLINHVKLGVFRSTPEPIGRFLEVNPAMEEITGYRRKELLQMNVADLYVYPKERGLVLEEVALSKGKAAKEVLFRKKDGTEIVVLDRKVVVKDDTGNILYFDGILEDITEHKQAEEREKQLQQELNLTSRLAAIGELAAGVAHEINNPLTGIIGFSERLLRKSTDETSKPYLQRIHDEASRAAKVVENLRTFARRREPKREYLDINEILERTLELRAYELRTSNIELVVEFAPSLPKVTADFQQIQEVFLNIILNAEQAISEANLRGKLSIKTQDMKDYIRISFTDEGLGIPSDQLDKVFDPFFTTRGERGGTGLGLSICHGIVAQHGGKIYAKSKSGKGSTFFVELPVTTE